MNEIELLLALVGAVALIWLARVITVIAVRFLFLFTVAEIVERYEDTVRGRRRPHVTRAERVVGAWSGTFQSPVEVG
jgi:hypothetical protein